MKKELHNLENAMEVPSYSNIKNKVYDILTKVRTIEHLSNTEDVKSLGLENELVELLNIIDAENDKKENLRAVAFMLANKL